MLRPGALPQSDCGPHQLLVETRYLSLDPYMLRALSGQGRRRFAVGAPMRGRVIGQVIQSSVEQFPIGSLVLGEAPWQTRSVLDPAGLQIITGEDEHEIAAHLGVLGTPGITAWLGMRHLARPLADKTVLVSSAAGAVGGLAGQIAKLSGAHVTGIAGGAEKVGYVTQTLGLDACLDRHDPDFLAQLDGLRPVDIYFDNVGGRTLDRILARMATDAKILICGQIEQYSPNSPPPITNFHYVLERRLQIIGFGVSQIGARQAAARSDLKTWLKHGRIAARTNFVDGLENAAETLFKLLEGAHAGKTVVRV
ncbi:hypothetical protein DFR49_0006 [Hephaestia caeni]|uniref:Enoyl reductase (ER) domain-containing protein n=1 Tax=Hephaestia caeni TaxID=645617 RepID=A0A397PE89_9SPHN|nr:NADP-dependent oxidoreductase [Hephaestia caeni]RIA45487.1 hypothetical protein DFR49_0006 [Hephaestia caeni]